MNASSRRRIGIAPSAPRRIADVESSDRFLVPTDYVAAVYGFSAAQRYIAEMDLMTWD
jgi:hypothetical protein